MAGVLASSGVLATSYEASTILSQFIESHYTPDHMAPALTEGPRQRRAAVKSPSPHPHKLPLQPRRRPRSLARADGHCTSTAGLWDHSEGPSVVYTETWHLERAGL